MTQFNTFYQNETNPEWRDVLQYGSLQVVPKGYNWDAKPDAETFSFLHKGTIRLFCYTASAHDRIIWEVGSGCIFREVGFLHRDISLIGLYSAVQIATTPCEVYNFSGKLLHDKEFISKYPHLFTSLLDSLSFKVGAVLTQLIHALKPKPEAMVAGYLLHLVKKFNNTVFAPLISQSDLALTLGLHRSTVCRVLQTFRNDGAIGVFTKKRLEIKDKAYLEQILKDSL